MTEKKKETILWAAAYPLLGMAVLWSLIPFVYGIVDDRSMMEIASGQYLGKPDAHMIFLGYWYSCLVAGCYRLLPNVDWYALGCLILQGVCLGLSSYRLLKKQSGCIGKVRAGLLVLLWSVVLGLSAIAQITFTTTSAVLAVTAVFWYMTMEAGKKGELAILFLLCFFAVELRFSVFCMAVPVCGVLWLFRVWEDGGKLRKHLLIPAAAAGALLLYGLGLLAGYGREDWMAYQKYNNIRSLIYDYDEYMFPRYEDETALYHGLGIESKERARNLYYYNYTADDRITPDFFGQYFAMRKLQAKQQADPAKRLWESVKTYGKGVLTGRYRYLHLFALLGYGALAVWYGLSRDGRRCLRSCLVPGVQIILWLYLVFRGRMPERVLVSMNLMLAVPLLALWMEALSGREIPEKCRRAGRGLLFMLLFMAAAWQVRAVRQENLGMAERNRSVEKLKEYCMAHPDNFYFNDVTSLAFSTYNVHLWQSEPYVMNYMSLGDWMSFSPLWEQKLSKEGIVSVKEALYGGDNVYLICSFEKGLTYLAGLYEGTSWEEVDRVREFGIYKWKAF